MKPEVLDNPTPMGANKLPRAFWIGGGILCLAVAALVGALVTKSIDAPRHSESTPLAMAGRTDAAPRIGTPVPPMVQDDVPPPPNASNTSPAPSAAPAQRAAAPAPQPVPARSAAPSVAPVAAPAPCSNCGTVESVSAVKVKGQGSGVGAVAGGVLGGVVGNQVGGGNGRTAMTVLGAIGGGFAGNEVERRTRSETLFDVRVRMRDGTHRVIRQNESWAVGTRVVVEGDHLRSGPA